MTCRVKATAAPRGCGQLAAPPLALWERTPPPLPLGPGRQSCEPKDINVSVVAPRVDVGLAAIPVHRQALDGLAVTLRRRPTGQGEPRTRRLASGTRQPRSTRTPPDTSSPFRQCPHHFGRGGACRGGHQGRPEVLLVRQRVSGENKTSRANSGRWEVGGGRRQEAGRRPLVIRWLLGDRDRSRGWGAPTPPCCPNSWPGP